MTTTIWQKFFFISYLLLLGICIGVELAVGVLTAPVIFFPIKFLGEGVLSHYQSGILMTQIFLRFNVLLMMVVLFLVIYEIYVYFIKKSDIVSFVMMFFIVVCSLLFVLYFTPFILEAQSQGSIATQTDKFKNMHKGSEFAIKIVMVSQITLFFRRLWLGLK